MSDIMKIADVIQNAPENALRLIQIQSFRIDPVSLKIVSVLAIYQKGQMFVNTLISGSEPDVYLTHLFALAQRLPEVVHFRPDWPPSICVNNAVVMLSKPHQLTTRTYLTRFCKCQKTK